MVLRTIAKENANRTAAANTTYKRDWCVLCAEIISDENLRKNLKVAEVVEEDLRKQSKNKSTYVAFMHSMNKGYVQYNFYREHTNLFDKIMERRADTFATIDQSDTRAMADALEKQGFTSMAETTKLLQTPEEIEAAAAEANARQEETLACRKNAALQFAKFQAAEAEAKEPVAEEPVAEEQVAKKRGRPKKNKKTVSASTDAPAVGDPEEDLITALLRKAKETDTEDEADTDIEGVEETKGGEPSEDAPASLEEENAMLRARVKQLEEFIMVNGMEAPLPVPLMELAEAESVVLDTNSFGDLEADAVVALAEEAEDEEEENEVVVFEHNGIKYYKDSEDQLYTYGDVNDAELIGWWNDKTKTIEEFDEDDE